MDKQLVGKYLSGHCSEKEASRVESWLATPEGQKFLKKEIERDIRVIKEFDGSLQYPKMQSEAESLFHRIDKNKKDSTSKEFRSRSNIYYRRWIGIAAATILSLLVVLFLVSKEQQEIVKQQAKSIYPKTITADANKDTSFSLTDGSRVRLEADSKLKIDKAFDEKLRTVELVGKAYFEVRNNLDRAFVVQTNYSMIRVLSTKFEVEAYPGQAEVIVKVDEGKVRFYSKDDRVDPLELREDESGILRFNVPDDSLQEAGTYNQSHFEKPLLVRHKKLEETPKIKFVDNRLFVALKYLERNYDVEIELENDALRSERFTLTTDHSLLGALERIADSLDLSITYNRDQNTLHLHQ